MHRYVEIYFLVLEKKGANLNKDIANPNSDKPSFANKVPNT